MASDLKRRYKEWEEWAITADQNDDGWQEDYPRPKWKLLMDAAIYEMTRQVPSQENIQFIDKCWAILHKKGQHLADYARTHIDQCWDVLLLLTESEYSDTRWQVYDVLSLCWSEGGKSLEKRAARSRRLLQAASTSSAWHAFIQMMPKKSLTNFVDTRTLT